MKDNDISKPQEQANTIKNCRSTNFIIKLTEYLLNGFLKDSKKLFNLFLRLQIHMINGDVNFYLPCCVTSLRFVFGLDNSFVRGLLQMAGTQLLNDISDSLTNKLDGEMWKEINGTGFDKDENSMRSPSAIWSKARAGELGTSISAIPSDRVKKRVIQNLFEAAGSISYVTGLNQDEMALEGEVSMDPTPRKTNFNASVYVKVF